MALQDAILQDMDSAPSDEAAKAFAPVYWQTAAGSMTIGHHLEGRGLASVVKRLEATAKANPKPRSERIASALGRENNDRRCKRSLKLDPMPKYPAAAEFRGYISTIALQVDIDPQGRAINPQLLASAPEQYFGEVVLKASRNLSFSPGTPWDPGFCPMPISGYVVWFNFVMQH